MREIILLHAEVLNMMCWMAYFSLQLGAAEPGCSIVTHIALALEKVSLENCSGRRPGDDLFFRGFCPCKEAPLLPCQI